MKEVTGAPIRFIGTGETLGAIEAFNAERIAGRILGMGDVVSLVEKAAEAIDEAGSTAAPGPTSPHDDAGSAGSASALVATRGAANPASASPTPRPPDVVAAAGLPTHRAPRVVSPVKKPTPSTDGQATTSAASDSVGTSDVHEDLATRLAAVGVDFNVTEFRTADAACTVDNLATVLSGEGLAVLARSLLAKLEGAAGSVVASAAAADASSE